MRLNELTPEQIRKDTVPLDEILHDSVYYPASRTDGRPIALCNTVWRRLGIDSFVYCDFDLSVQGFLADTRTMHGYHLLAYRYLAPEEYIPAGWKMEMVPSRTDGRRGYWDTFLGHGGPEHRACWVVMERDADMSPVHGPERLSVLYVCGEGLATFQQLYCARGIAPNMLCFIQCWGFAGNWTDFSACGAPFHRTLVKYRGSTPEWLCFGDCCGIHGAIRLTDLGYAGVRCLGYRTRKALERTAGDSITEVEAGPGRSVLTYRKGARSFAAVSISHHMEYAVYDVTGSRFDLPALLDWLILDAPGRMPGPDASLNAWVGVRGLDPEDGVVPVIDEKLDWRDLDGWPTIAKAMAIVGSVRKVYGEGGMCACSRLVEDAMTWARVVLEEADIVRPGDGRADSHRAAALRDARLWFRNRPHYNDTVFVNIGFGRGRIPGK